MINTLYLKKTGAVIPKKAVLTLKAEIDGHGTKRVGKLELNVSDYKETGVKLKEFSIQSSLDRNAKIVLSISAYEIGAPTTTDDMSDISGGSGISMGTDDNYTGPALSTEPAEEEKRVIPGTQGRPPAVLSGLKFDLSPKKQVEKQPTEPLRQRILELEETLRETEEKHEVFKANCTDQLDVLEREIQESEADRSRLISDNHASMREIAKLKDESTRLKRNLERAEAACKRVSESEDKAELEALKKELLSLAATADRLQQDKLTTEKECSRLTAQLSTARVNYELAQHSIKRLREELATGRRPAEEDEVLSAYQRQTDNIISQLKSQLKEAEQLRFEVLNKQEEDHGLDVRNQRTDSSSLALTTSLRQELEQYKKQLEQAKQAQASAEKQLAEVTSEYKHKLKEAYADLKALEEESITANFEVRKLQRASRVSIIQEGLSNYQDISEKLKAAEAKIAQLTSELRAAGQSANETLVQRLQITQKKLENVEYAASVEKAQHIERILQLEAELERQERAIGRLKREQESQSVAQTDETSLSQSLQLCKLQIDDLTEDLEQTKEALSKSESRGFELKISYANIELERDTIAQKCRDAQEKLRMFSTQFTTMEVELCKANERYCQAINTNNEMEYEMHALRKQLELATTTSKKRTKR